MFARWMDGYWDIKGQRVQICSNCHVRNLSQPDICPACSAYMVSHDRYIARNTGRYPWPEKVLEKMFYEQRGAKK